MHSAGSSPAFAVVDQRARAERIVVSVNKKSVAAGHCLCVAADQFTVNPVLGWSTHAVDSDVLPG